MTRDDQDDEEGDPLEHAHVRSNGVTEWRWSVYRRLREWWRERG